MPCLQMIGADDLRGKATMQGDFDLQRDELSLDLTSLGKQVTSEMLTRLRMPILDGFHFLSYLMDHGFELPIVLRNAPDSDKAQHYLLAPQSSSQLPPFPGRRAMPHPKDGVRKSPPGPRHGVTLLEFLSFCAEERQTRVLEVSAAGRTAFFHLTFGTLIHAICEGREGLKVFFEVLRWESPSLRILPTLPGLDISITAEMGLLLSQASAVEQPAPAARLSQGSSPVAESVPDSPAPGTPPGSPRPPRPSSSQRGHTGFVGRLSSWLAEALRPVVTWWTERERKPRSHGSPRSCRDEAGPGIVRHRSH